MRKLILSLSVLVFLIGCSEEPSEPKKAVELPPVNFVMIQEGNTSGIKADMTSIYKLDTAESFQVFWAEHSKNIQPPIAAPAIDFTKNMIIAIVDTDQPSSGYGLTVDKLQVVDDKLYIFAIRKQPGAGCVNLGMISQPFVMVEVPQSDLIPELRLTTETVACQ